MTQRVMPNLDRHQLRRVRHRGLVINRHVHKALGARDGPGERARAGKEERRGRGLEVHIAGDEVPAVIRQQHRVDAARGVGEEVGRPDDGEELRISA